MKKGGSLDYLADSPPSTRQRVSTVSKSASFHAFEQHRIESPPRSPTFPSPAGSPLFQRRTPEPPAASHKTMVHLGSQAQSPLLIQAIGGDSPASSARKPVPLPKPNRSSPKLPPRNKGNIYDEVSPLHYSSPPPPRRNGGSDTKLSKPMTIKQLAEEYRQKFPLMVRVYGGFLGASERETFSEGDLLNILFLKQAKMVTLEYGSRGRKMKVPMNSALQFGILYNPEDNTSGAMMGYEFKSANQLMAQSPLPKLVCATESSGGSSDESSLSAGEILLLREVSYSSSTGIKHLVCISMETGTLKKIPENCIASFTTDPYKTRLVLSRIIKHFPLPVSAVVFMPNVDLDDEQSPFDDQSLVTICSCQKEMTLVANSYLEDETATEEFSDGNDFPVFDIPIDLPIMKVQVLEKNSHDSEKLYEETRKIYERFEKIQPSHNPISVAGESSTYFLAVQKDKKSAFQLVEPEAAYQGHKRLQGADQQHNHSDSFSSIRSAGGEPIYAVPRDSHLQNAANIYQTPSNIPVHPQAESNQKVSPAASASIYQVPRSVTAPQTNSQEARESDPSKRFKGSNRYVALTIPSQEQPPTPPRSLPVHSPPSSPARTKAVTSPAIESLTYRSRSASPYHQAQTPIKGELETLREEFRRVLESNQQLHNAVHGEFIILSMDIVIAMACYFGSEVYSMLACLNTSHCCVTSSL